MILLDKISKHYTTAEGKEHILQDLSLHVEQGEFVAIMGPSGSGKSTLLHILGGLDRPCEGKYMFQGYEMNRISDRKRTAIRNEQIGFVFQNFQLISNLSVYQNILLPLTYHRRFIRNKKQKIHDALETVDMLQHANKYPHQLSGGQKQRVAIARAIMNTPALLLADEPTGSLDERNSKAVMDLFQQLHKQGTTILFITHDKDAAKQAKRTLQLRYGKVEEREYAISKSM